jgi:tellurite resistance-related uncharacterized protein
MPLALRRNHRVAKGTWGRLQVHDGQMRFRADTHPPLDVIVVPGSPQPIPPDVVHHVEPIGPVRFAVEFLRR